MKCDVARARREGVLLSKHQRDCGWIKGELTIQEEFDKEHTRWTRVARVRVDFGESFPPLYDATVIVLHSGWLTITGFELGHHTNLGKPSCFHQSWFAVPPRAPSVWPIPPPEKA